MHDDHYNSAARALGQAAPQRADQELTQESTTPAGGPALHGEQGIINSRDRSDACGQAQAVTAKAFATLQARLAIAGWCLQRELHDTEARCSYRAWRWGRAAELPDLAAVAAFAYRVGAPA